MAFVIIFTSILGLMYGYVGWRLMSTAGIPSPWNYVAWGVIIFFWLSVPIRFVFWFRGYSSTLVDWFAWLAFLGLAFFSILFVLFLTRDIIWLLILLGGKLLALMQGTKGAEAAKSIPMDPAKRRLILNVINAGILGVTGAYIGWGISNAKSRIRVKKIDIRVPNLPKEFNGYTILQVTDIHVGPTIKKKFVERIVEIARDLRPDLLAMTGDLVDGSVESLREDVAPLAELDIPHGKYFVTGNHEYYSGVSAWVAHIRDELGFRVLNNEHVVLKKGKGHIILAGVTDLESRNMDPENASDPQKAIRGASEESYKILLAHQPRSIFKAAEAGFDLQLSGHTHGGQFFPWNLVVGLFQPFVKGLHKYENTDIYVCTGVGYWGPPVRIGVPPQVTLLKLVRE
ncbi:MAG: metallophosphoesterase [Candidatus Marinimicrobia bacterium]|nr:metallophosphoesterase [Candidatus Neomarinimicrobiota bacterium]